MQHSCKMEYKLGDARRNVKRPSATRTFLRNSSSLEPIALF